MRMPRICNQYALLREVLIVAFHAGAFTGPDLMWLRTWITEMDEDSE